MLSHHKMHSLLQRGLRRSTDYGDTQLRTQLVNQSLALFFSSLLPLVGRGYHVRQARNILLSGIHSLAQSQVGLIRWKHSGSLQPLHHG
jgi:hypothetical protein